jgi:hypothetical protein
MAEYINGKEFFEELKIYNVAYLESIKLGEGKPQVSDKIANAIVQISTRLMNSFNFVGYSFKDEMISDAILKCFDKVHRFDPSISENAFAFFTQCAYNAAINRIKIEQKESSVKARLIREKLSSEFVQHGVDADADDGSNSFVEFLKENDAYIDYIEVKKENIKNDINPSLKHRNKTAYPTKKVVEVIPVFDLSDFEVA